MNERFRSYNLHSRPWEAVPHRPACQNDFYSGRLVCRYLQPERDWVVMRSRTDSGRSGMYPLMLRKVM